MTYATSTKEAKPKQHVDAQAEQALLSTIMADPNTIHQVRRLVSSDMFAAGWNNAIFNAMIDLADRKTPIEFIALTNRLEERNELDLVGTPNLTALIMVEATALYQEHYVNIVLDMHSKRLLQAAGSRITESTFDSDLTPAEMKRQAIELVNASVSDKGTTSWVSMGDATSAYLDRLDPTKRIPPISTGYKTINNLMGGGFQRRKSYCICGRPGMGKTSLAFLMALEQAKAGHKVGFFSMEMPPEDLIARSISAMTGINGLKVSSGIMSEEEEDAVINTSSDLLSLPISFNHVSTYEDLDLATRIMHARHGLDIIYVDYLQLLNLKHDKENRNLAIGHITRGLKALAMDPDINIAVVPLSQMSRINERDKDPRPTLAALRDSGSIEQDQDAVLGAYRESYYKPDTVNRHAEIIFLKNRGGPTGTAKLQWEGSTTRFFEI